MCGNGLVIVMRMWDVGVLGVWVLLIGVIFCFGIVNVVVLFIVSYCILLIIWIVGIGIVVILGSFLCLNWMIFWLFVSYNVGD